MPVTTRFASTQKVGTYVVKHPVSERITVSDSCVCVCVCVCVASYVIVGGTREEVTILIFFSENKTSVSTVCSVGILINIWTTSIIHYTDIFITFWKYDTGCPWNSFPFCKFKLCSENFVLYEKLTVFVSILFTLLH
jgi:hypothetical protein